MDIAKRLKHEHCEELVSIRHGQMAWDMMESGVGWGGVEPGSLDTDNKDKTHTAVYTCWGKPSAH